MNYGVDKDDYLNSDFALTFPTIDHLTDALVKIGFGAHIFKVDISGAFRHLKVDLFDLDLLGLNWNGFYLDMCIPFGTRHRNHFPVYQRCSMLLMHQCGYDVINHKLYR